LEIPEKLVVIPANKLTHENNPKTFYIIIKYNPRV